MLQLSSLQNHLKKFPEKVTVISPIVNSKSLKGPTAKMMLELGHEISVNTIGEFYKNYSQRIFIDNADKENSDFLTGVGYEVHYSNLVMNNTLSKNKLAENIIKVLEAK